MHIRPLLAGLLVGSLFSGCARSTEPTSNDAAPPMPSKALTYDFDSAPTGQMPPGFTAALTGAGAPGEWRVQQVDDAPSGRQVLAQLSDDRTNARYPHLVRDDASARDADISVRFKTLSGAVDASAGIVFRYQDRGNYYVVRANALEDNVVAYKTQNGKRSNIGVSSKGGAYGVETEVPHQQWNTLRVIANGPVFEVFLNGRKLFETEDTTFTTPGKIGVWTKADAVTQFDDLSVTSLDKSE